jgi:riboflavin kinase/FMN adenylyltransferase
MKLVLALGNFDALHVGHIKIIEETKRLAKENSAIPAIFTFEGDLSAYLGKGNGVAFTFMEKIEKLETLGIHKVVYDKLTPEFMDLNKTEFLEYLIKKYDIAGFVCGDDFTFGKNAEGNGEYLKEFAEKNGQFLKIVSEVTYNGERASTTRLKKLLSDGNMIEAKGILGDKAYFISGKVLHGRGQGKSIGYPTVNIEIPAEKYSLKEGVYAGYTVIDGVKYKAVINYGSAPTFNYKNKVLEAFIIGFDGLLYGEHLSIYFEKFIRDIVKFSSADELKKQIDEDVKKI